MAVNPIDDNDKQRKPREMRPFLKLYEILLDNFYKTDADHTCVKMLQLLHRKLINEDEYYALKKDFESRKPGLFSKFRYNRNFQWLAGTLGGWWNVKPGGMEQRRLFLEKVIKDIKSNR
jgi:hypothetical protein